MTETDMLDVNDLHPSTSARASHASISSRRASRSVHHRAIREQGGWGNPLCPVNVGAGRNIASATLQYWNGATWVTSTQFSAQQGDIKVDLPFPVTTTKLRMYDMKSGPGGNSGNSIIWEWHVDPVMGCVPPP